MWRVVVQDACFVRFLGHLTGRAGLAQLAATFISDPRLHFAVNQSVRAQVVQVHPALPLLTLAIGLRYGLCPSVFTMMAESDMLGVMLSSVLVFV